jgi:hypothetical protein
MTRYSEFGFTINITVLKNRLTLMGVSHIEQYFGFIMVV